MNLQQHREMLERHTDRAERELSELRNLLAKACHVNALNEQELQNLVELVREYEGTKSLHEGLTEQLERAGV